MSGLHVSGLLVHARPESAAAVRKRLETLPGVSVESLTESGRLVTITEQPSNEALADIFHRIQDTDGVLSASLVYHYTDQHDVPDEEMTR